jgi:hypothetical protein
MSDCQELKRIDDACFYKWYWEKFMKNKAGPEQPCVQEFQKYRACVEEKFGKEVPVAFKLRARDVQSPSDVKGPSDVKK